MGLGYHYFDRADNHELGGLLRGDVNDARGANGGDLRGGKKLTMKFQRKYVVTDKMLNDLDDLARVLIQDGSVRLDRTYQEVRVTPQEVEASVDYFCAQEDYKMPTWGEVVPLALREIP